MTLSCCHWYSEGCLIMMMRLTNRAVITAAALIVLAAPAIPAASAAARPDQTYINWTSYLNGLEHTSYQSAATSITPATAPSLTQAWKWKVPKGTMSGSPAPALYSSPTVYDGTIYIGADTGNFYAISESTGTVLWSDFLGFVPHLTCTGSRGISDTATVEADPNTGVLTVYVSGGNGYLYALNASTGATIWQSVIALPSPTQNNYYDWSSPTVANGHVYIGVSSQCNKPSVRGGLKQYDQTTGALQNFFQTGTKTSKYGASIWSSASVDPSGNVFISTGNAEEGLGQSIVELNGSTLANEGYWTLPVSQRIDHDSDFGGSTTIWTATLSGTPTEMVGACNKNGTYYAFQADDLAAGPVWQDALGAGSTSPPICAAAGVYDGTNLYLSGPPTTIGGTSYGGSVEAVNPATGAVLWQTGLGGTPIGTPSLDGGGVLAVETFSTAGDYLLNASTGAILSHLATGVEWGQPVYADKYLLIPTQGKGLWAMTNASTTARRRGSA
jgi:outer membrane protein assembly factor BamB